ncbi:MAG TPA: cellulase family glycosylhydrolase [Candidatus Angelobacter sp.]|nr:cellulase family glycosylhydrolase [Candidatus Angelobacter sp.]
MKRIFRALLIYIVLTATFLMAQAGQRWSAEKANAWYQQQPWLVGANYIPASAINELEMWQADTFNPAQIDQELGWAESLGMNTMRVFLHDLLWEQDAKGFQQRLDQFLSIAAKHHIRPMLVLFDSCWDPEPKLGKQPAPKQGVHNSGWVQSPGAKALEDKSQYPRLKAYVIGVVATFANDPRILAWDVWNEPGGFQYGYYDEKEPKNKIELVKVLLPQAFAWARSANPTQPLTSGLWEGDWPSAKGPTPMEKIQLEHSDILTFHNYSWPENFERRVIWLQKQGRPVICTEYMARSAGSTFDGVLPIAKKHNVGAINWGLVIGKTQTNLPWESWDHPYVLNQPSVWFHDVFKADGTPYRESEAALIRQLTGKSLSPGVAAK